MIFALDSLHYILHTLRIINHYGSCNIMIDLSIACQEKSYIFLVNYDRRKINIAIS